MKTLLQLAKNVKPKNTVRRRVLENKEGFDLAMAWAKGEITTGQVQKSIFPKNRSTGNCLYYLACAFRWGVQNKKLKRI